MDDKATPATETVEYKFTEAETDANVNASPLEQSGSETVATPAAVNKSMFDLKNVDWKRLVRPLIIIVAIIVVYLGFNFFSGQKGQGLEQKKLAMQENAALVQQQQAAMIRPVQSTASSSLPMIDNDQMTQMQSVMQQKIDNAIKQLAGGQESIANMKDAISKNERDVADINQKIEQLTTVMQQLLADIEKIKSSMPVAKVKKISTKLPVAYHVRAIVPGRVWLESADGDSVTLRVGDKLAGYGEVKAIVPRQGMVVMSNGSVIQYGVGDF